jgi:hypothetical protein
MTCSRSAERRIKGIGKSLTTKTLSGLSKSAGRHTTRRHIEAALELDFIKSLLSVFGRTISSAAANRIVSDEKTLIRPNIRRKRFFNDFGTIFLLLSDHC